jgi:hypothetical protein
MDLLHDGVHTLPPDWLLAFKILDKAKSVPFTVH